VLGVADSCAGDSFPAGERKTGDSGSPSPSPLVENDALVELGM
jgi:hypothetical protein